jgi:hypothetical protein
MNDTVEQNAEVAAENQAAAESVVPENAVPPVIEVAMDEPARTEPQMFVNPEIHAALAAQEAGVDEDGMTQEEANTHMQKLINDQFMEYDFTETAPEQQLVAAMKGFLDAAGYRYERFLKSGQTTAQSEAVRCVKEAIFHLDAHITAMQHHNPEA